MKKFFFFFAAAGWIIGLVVHLLSVFDYDVIESFPFVWALHVGAILVMFPAIIELKKTAPALQVEGQYSRRQVNVFKHLSQNAPRWLVAIVVLSFAYAFINFILFKASHQGSPEIINGQYRLNSKTITALEYHHFNANLLRGFSGHWLFFFGFASAVLFPFKKSN